MPETKPVGVAYSDPTLNGAVIDNSVIGATTRAAGSFTTVDATGAVKANSDDAPASGGAGPVGVTFSSTASLGLFCGTGAPTLSAAKGSLYVNTTATTTTTRLYVNTDGSTTWTAFTSAA